MPWYGWVGLALGAYIAYTIATRHRNRRVVAELTIPPTGTPTVELGPSNALPSDLCLAALCYASKVRWLVNSEFAVSKDLLTELFAEACDFWDEGSGDLIDRMPTASSIRKNQDHPRAVQQGEVFRISLYRTGYQNLTNRAWVINTIPRPGLAANLPWSAILLLNTVSVVLPVEARSHLGRALRIWFQAAMQPDFDKQTTQSLGELFRQSATAYEDAGASA